MGIIHLHDRKEKRAAARERAKSIQAHILKLSENSEDLKKHIEENNLEKALEDLLYRMSVRKEDAK